MEYEFALTVPAATAAATPFTSDLKLARGIIRKATVHFPAGSQYLVHVQVYSQSHQIYPLEEDRDLAYEDYTWETTVPYPLATEPYRLKVKAWSPSCDYAHVIRVGIHLEPEAVPTALDRLIELLTKFLRLLGAR